jgi:rare lipoprotein A
MGVSRRADRGWRGRAVAPCAIRMLAMSIFLSYAHAGHPSETYTGQQIAQTGFATYYASRFEGRRTASGTTFRNDAPVAAHPSLPFGALARVTNLAKGRSVIVRITDRGPASGPRSKGVIIDLSQQAARQLNMMSRGRVHVAVEVLAATKNRHSIQSVLHSTRQAVKSPPLAFAGNLTLRMDTTLVLTPPLHNHVSLVNADSER